jgi:hypothetical protein
VFKRERYEVRIAKHVSVAYSEELETRECFVFIVFHLYAIGNYEKIRKGWLVLNGTHYLPVYVMALLYWTRK